MHAVRFCGNEVTPEVNYTQMWMVRPHHMTVYVLYIDMPKPPN